MKKLLNSMLLFVSILTSMHIFAMQPPRHQLYSLINPLIANPHRVDWPAVFAVLDEMQGAFPINAYRTNRGMSLLGIAVRTNNILAAKKLLEEYGAVANTPELRNQRPLIIAILHQDLPMIQLLLKYGANPYAEDSNGRDSFHFSQLSGNTRIEELLDLYK